MPQYITIKNFGPIKDIEKMEVKDFMLFIGERATGKSTIAKLIHFFQTIDYVIALVLLRNAQPNSAYRDSIEQVISSRIKRYYPSYLINKHTQIKYYFSTEIFIEISGANDAFDIKYSDKLTLVLTGLRAYAQRNSISAINSEKEVGTLDILMGSLHDSLQEQLGTVDNDVYFPSQRSITSPSEWNNISGKTNPNIDEIQDQFITIKSFTKRKYYDIIHEILNNPNIYYTYIARVLNGQVYMDKNIDSVVIKLDSGHNIQIEDASSGQQESFWILLILASYIGEKRPLMAFIEEPEAGLDPKTQSLLMEAIAAFGNHKLNSKRNQVIVTTHSPYILATVNNLMYAHQVGQEYPEQVKKVINESLWLDPSRVGAYECKDGGIVDLIVEDGLIMNEELDRASIDINRVHNELFAIQNEATHEL